MKIKNFSNIYSGGTPSTQEKSYWNGNLPWLSSGETRNNYINYTEKHITKEAVNNSSTKLAKKNSIVIASAGQGLTRGQTSFLNINTYINQSLICIEPNSNIILPKYLFFNLLSKYELLRNISDSSAIRGSLTTKQIADLDISIPNMEYQRHIVDTVRLI